MEQLFEQMAEILESGKDAMLVTIIASSGSTPNGIGARMLVDASGRLRGTIGGGAVEHRAEALAKEALAEKHSYTKAFILRRNEVEDLGMICGGDVKVYFQYVLGGEAGAAFAAAVAESFGRDEDAWLITDLAEAGDWTMGLYTEGGGLRTFGQDSVPERLSTMPDTDFLSLLGRGPVRREMDGRTVYSEPIVRAGRVVIFGGGHVSQELVPVLSHLGFRCVVFEDRPEFVTKALFPTAWDLILGDFGDIAASITLSSSDYIVVMTRGHAADLEVQKQVLRSRYAYVGVIGSKSKIAAVSEKLRQAGISQRNIDEVHMPIGLAIKAKSPAELAISIAGEMIEVRAGREA
ncbi:MAG: XdhC family protein [Oscillospiraceae bacterium]